MNILVLGGTGAMGVHLVELLSQRGDAVFVTSRRERPSRKNVTYVQGDAHNNDFLQTLLNSRRWDAIVDFMVYRTEEFRHRMPQLLAATAQYVFLSSSRVYADSAGPITEDSPRLLDVSADAAYLKTDEYALAKARQENALRTESRGGGKLDDCAPLYHIQRNPAATGGVGKRELALPGFARADDCLLERHRRPHDNAHLRLRRGTEHRCIDRQRQGVGRSVPYHLRPTDTVERGVGGLSRRPRIEDGTAPQSEAAGQVAVHIPAGRVRPIL